MLAEVSEHEETLQEWKVIAALVSLIERGKVASAEALPTFTCMRVMKVTLNWVNIN